MTAGEVSQVPELDLEKGLIPFHKPESQVKDAAVQVDKQDIEPSFFRNYDDEALLNRDARIGGYQASKFGSWELPSRPLDSDRLYPFTLHPVAKEIACLLKCRDLPDTEFWKVAEEEWKKKLESTQKIVDAKDAKVLSLISEIYQLVGLAAAFQGLLIAAAAQLSTMNNNCNGIFWWFLALSLFATAVTATGVQHKVRYVEVFKKTRDHAKLLLYERERLLKKLTEEKGPGFNLAPRPIKVKPDPGQFKTFLKKRIFEYSAFTLTCLIAFGVICGLALRFMCN